MVAAFRTSGRLPASCQLDPPLLSSSRSPPSRANRWPRGLTGENTRIEGGPDLRRALVRARGLVVGSSCRQISRESGSARTASHTSNTVCGEPCPRFTIFLLVPATFITADASTMRQIPNADASWFRKGSNNVCSSLHSESSASSQRPDVKLRDLQSKFTSNL